MRVYLCGQKHFGRAVLEMLLEQGHEVAGVSTPLFKRDGKPDRLWTLARNKGLKVLEAGSLKAGLLPDGVDLIVAAHSHDVVGQATLRKAKLGGIGYHPSLLPRHRGRDAVRWTVHMGDAIAGGTVYWLTKGVDCGPVASQGWCFVRPGDTAESLWRRDLSPMGVRLLRQTLKTISGGRIVRVPQRRDAATWEPSWERPPLFRPDLPMLGETPGYVVGVVGGEDGVPIAVDDDIPWYRKGG